MQADPCKRLRLQPWMRLKRGADFKRIKLEGQRVASGCLLVNWLAPSPLGHLRFAVVVSNKLGGAVVRNRARRLLREAFRLHWHELAKPADMVLVARPSITDKKCAEVERDLLTALSKAGLLKNDSPKG